MEKIIIYCKEHKRSVAIALIVFVLILILLLVKSCSDSNQTDNKDRYRNHVVTSLSNQNQYFNRLLRYLEQFSGPIDCSEDVANQLASFSAYFLQESKTFESLTYLGEEPLQNGATYTALASNYRVLGETLAKISDAMHQGDIPLVMSLYDDLADVLKAIDTTEVFNHE